MENGCFKKWLGKLPKFIRIILKIIGALICAIFLLFLILIIYRFPLAIERSNTAEIVADIHSQKLTMDDVIGKNLPPEPDAKLNDATLEGIDANKNGIRDDVELAIFKLYPDSARIRSGALQYAKGLQMHFRKDITNSKIFVAVIQEEGRGGSCFYQALPSKDVKLAKTDEEASKAFAVKDAQDKKIINLVFNIETRKNKENENYKKYMTTFSSLNSPYCDIDPLRFDK
ncbi:hypothetical protein HY750_03770 [Candidatus Kuenenbacteria bacterium]|nr:hypothetical protein [Candidatus Kuenenbacteria bacterium]